MMRKIIIAICVFLGAGLFTFQISEKEFFSRHALSATPMKFKIPKGFPGPQYKFENNPLTVEGFELGRKLFYDGRLSKDGNFPCASCHQQFAAFATFDHALSHGFKDQFTTRNAPALFNVAWMKELHWDGGINNLEVQPLAPITAGNEMAENIDTVIAKLKADPGYRRMFTRAFGDGRINSQRMLKALAQFVAMLVSANSKYDKVQRGEAVFSPSEQLGYAVFRSKCAACHKEPLFTDDSYRNTGLTVNGRINDYGRMAITGNPNDSLKFKVPSLRNVYLTFPYGHDGRFYSVGAVVDHYRFHVVNGPTTDSLLRNKLNISDDERFNLLLFLRTLTDSGFISNKRFSAPPP